MFEVIMTVCLLSAPDICREVLLPGYETEHLAACEARLDSLQDAALKKFPSYHPSIRGKCAKVPQGLAFDEVHEGVFVHRGAISDAAPDNLGDIANTGFIVGDTSIAVVDAGGSRQIGEKMYRAIRQRSDLPISHVILTHMHPDHVLGASVFSDIGATIVGHGDLTRALNDRARTYLRRFGSLIGKRAFIGTQIIVPDVGVAEKMTIDLGNRVLVLQSWPQSHSGTDVTVLDTGSGILFTGDLVFHGHLPTLDGSLKGWQAVLTALSEMPVTRIVPGHGGPVLKWPRASVAMQRYLSVLERDTRAAIKTGATLGAAVETIAASEKRHWQLFELYNPRNATVAYTELEWE